MIPEISAALGSGKLAIDIVKSMVGLKNQVDVQLKAMELLNVIIDLQGKLQEAQAASTAIQAELSDMAAKQRQLEDWSREKANYRLHRFDTGGLVYHYDDATAGNAPPHDLCAQCYQQNIKSILQPGNADWYKVLKCHRCSSSVRVERIDAWGSVTVQPTKRDRWDGF